MEYHLKNLGKWNGTPKEAIEIQERLSASAVSSDRFAEISTIAGIDVGYERNGTITKAAVTVLSYPTLQPTETALARSPTRFPYIPGLLSFRELPGILVAFEKLNKMPDLLICDGHGYAHPRRFGLACHLGVILDIPSIGVGKTKLIGEFQPVGNERGCWTPLVDSDEIIGAAVRTRDNVKPVFVSSGHRVGLESAIRFVLNCSPKYRVPEPIRKAHALVSG